MKQSCRELESLLTPYVDGETTPDQCAKIEAHLSTCPPCRRQAEAEANARDVVRRCRDQLREPAPPSLHARCRQLAHARQADAVVAGSSAPGVSAVRAPFVSASPRDWRWWAPVSAAITLLLAVGGVVLFGLLSDRGTAIASQLATDHLRCLRQVAERGAAAADRAQMAARWEKSRGWFIALPPTSGADDVEFVALRRCMHAGGEMAHAIYRDHGRLVSLFIFPDASQQRANLEIMGQRATIWSQGGHSYAVLAEESPVDVERLVAFFKRGLP